MAPPQVKEAWTFNPANFEYIKEKFMTGNRIKSPLYSQRPFSRHTFDTFVSELSVASIRSCDSLFLTGGQHKQITRQAITGSELDQQAEPKPGSGSETSHLTCSENIYVASSMATPVSISTAKQRNALNYLPFGTQVKVMNNMWNMSRRMTTQKWIDALESPSFSDFSSYDVQSPIPSPTPVPKEVNKVRDFFQEANNVRDIFQEAKKVRDRVQKMLQRLTQKKTKVTEIEILPCKTDDVNKDDDTSSSISCKASRSFRSRVQKFFSRFVVCGKAKQD